MDCLGICPSRYRLPYVDVHGLCRKGNPGIWIPGFLHGGGDIFATFTFTDDPTNPDVNPCMVNLKL